MEKMPEIFHKEDGSAFWRNTFNSFEALVYLPHSDLPGDILNYGFIAPYLLVFTDNRLSYDEAEAFADSHGLKKIASSYDTSVVFIYPGSGDWEIASPDILSEIITNSKIHQYYKDGVVIANNAFRHSLEGYFIRGAIFRIILCGFGKGADYIARKCIRHFEGDGLWGRSDLAPAACVLTGLSVLPDIQADDIPVISYGNTKDIDLLFGDNCKYFIRGDIEKQRCDEDWAAAFTYDFYNYIKKFRRMNGPLQIDEDLEKEGLITESGITEVKTSKDNCGDDKETSRHKIAYFSFYNKGLFNKPVPLVLGFHGGGDSSFFFSIMAGWAKIAHRHNFLLVAVENHLNSTATEMIELVETLKNKYNIDESRIYATGFSMGGCKTWDLIQEYPELLAAAAPMDATFEVGCNSYGNKVEGGINTTKEVPVFYAGGEITPLPELPCQAQKCLDRMAYVLSLNKAKASKRYSSEVKLENKEKWENKIWGINGDSTESYFDNSRNATLTLQNFSSEDGRVLSVFGSISGQGHDCREHTCEQAWLFMSKFYRDRSGEVKME